MLWPLKNDRLLRALRHDPVDTNPTGHPGARPSPAIPQVFTNTVIPHDVAGSRSSGSMLIILIRNG